MTTPSSTPMLHESTAPVAVRVTPGKPKTEDTTPDQRLAEKLKRLRNRVHSQQEMAARKAFDLANECAALREEMTKGKLLAFLQDEYQIPRSDALSYFCLPEALGVHRAMIEESNTDVAAILPNCT